ncbi:MAG: hypothetical protein OK454_01795 [Thaumarchaeota archaeon]|nr:hypothetical protein [Nitrososphaerota archaeon]
MSKPCQQCPWRLANQGKKHKHAFYTKANLRRLWGQIRRGGGAQSCHLTDPSHPDHIDAGAKPGAKAQECPGSVIVVLREVTKMAEGNEVTNDGVKKYLAMRKKNGLTKRGILFWVVSRIQFGGVPMIGGLKLPEVDVTDKEIGLPMEFETG